MTSNCSRIRLFILDDHTLVRDMLKLFFEDEADVEVVGEGGTLEEALATTADPNLVLADLVLEDGQGAEVIAALRDRLPNAKVLALTMLDDPYEMQRALARGAHGYVPKGPLDN